MLKENSRKWKTDDHKIMNWSYNEKDDYYLDLNGVRFNFSNYSKRTDKYGFTRDFKVYTAEKFDDEPVFGRLEASLEFNRFSVRGSERVEKEMGFVVLAMNIDKLVTVVTKINKMHKEKVSQKSNFRFLRYFSLMSQLLFV